MINKFKYDYNNKLFLINLLLFLIFLILSIIAIEKIIGFIIFLIMAILAFCNSLFIRTQGIKITNKNYIVIVDQLLIRKLCVEDIKYVSLKQIPKKTRSKLYGFFNEFFYPSTYMSNCNYVYNQGRVYNISFHMRDGTIVESYFGWLYREKEKIVSKIEKKLLDFIEKTNIICQEK